MEKMKEKTFDYYMDSEGIIHDKSCSAVKENRENMTGITKITHTSELHRGCRAFVYIRMIAGSKNTEKYFHWFKHYQVDSVALRRLALDKKAKCQLRGNKMYIDIRQDRWIIETNISNDLNKGRLYHCNYKRNGEDKLFNSSAFHEQFSYDKAVSSLVHYISGH